MSNLRLFQGQVLEVCNSKLYIHGGTRIMILLYKRFVTP